MRNLDEYPINHQEVLDTLYDLWVEEFNQNRIGDMRPLILTTVSTFLKQPNVEKDFKEFLKTFARVM